CGEFNRRQPQSSNSKSMLSLMKRRLENAKVDSVNLDLPRAFIPCVKIYAIINEHNVQTALAELETYVRVEEIEQTTRIIAPPIHGLSDPDRIRTQYRRVFAALILIGKAESISEFINHQVHDAVMC